MFDDLIFSPSGNNFPKNYFICLQISYFWLISIWIWCFYHQLLSLFFCEICKFFILLWRNKINSKKLIGKWVWAKTKTRFLLVDISHAKLSKSCQFFFHQTNWEEKMADKCHLKGKNMGSCVWMTSKSLRIFFPTFVFGFKVLQLVCVWKKGSILQKQSSLLLHCHLKSSGTTMGWDFIMKKHP